MSHTIKAALVIAGCILLAQLIETAFSPHVGCMLAPDDPRNGAIRCGIIR